MMWRTTIRLLPALALAVAQAGDGAALKSPQKVQEALQVLAYIQADMASKLPAKAYDRLPHESQEFLEAAPALRDALAGEPAEFRKNASALLGKAQAAARTVAAVSRTHDAARIAAAVAAVDSALQALDQQFPAELRPKSGMPEHRPGDPGTGPPADVR